MHLILNILERFLEIFSEKLSRYYICLQFLEPLSHVSQNDKIFYWLNILVEIFLFNLLLIIVFRTFSEIYE